MPRQVKPKLITVYEEDDQRLREIGKRMGIKSASKIIRALIRNFPLNGQENSDASQRTL